MQDDQDKPQTNGLRPVDDTGSNVVELPKVTGRTGQAIDLMVWQGMPRDEAAKAVGMLPKTLYNAFREARVKAYYRSQLDALATSACARNIHRLETIRDAADNMPAVQAIRMLEELAAGQGARSGLVGDRSPGLQIVITQAAPPPHPEVAEMRVIDVQAESSATEPVKHEG